MIIRYLLNLATLPVWLILSMVHWPAWVSDALFRWYFHGVPA